MKKQLLTIALATSLFACSQDDGSTDAQKAADTTAPAPAQEAGAGSAVSDPGHTGRVISSASAGGYTYLQVQNSGGTFWLAASQASVSEGMDVRWGDYAVMKDFQSKGLGKTFEQILFVSRVVPETAQSATASQNTGVVKSVTSAGGYNYIEVDVGGTGQWLAAPVSPVAIGNNISWSGASEMKNFHSKSLNRDFESILFVGSISVNKG